MWSLAVGGGLVTNILQPDKPPALDMPMLVGFLGSLVTVVCFIERRRSRGWLLALAVCLAVMSLYGLTREQFSLGVIAGLWAAATFREWRVPRRRTRRLVEVTASRRVNRSPFRCDESRMTRMFGAP